MIVFHFLQSLLFPRLVEKSAYLHSNYMKSNLKLTIYGVKQCNTHILIGKSDLKKNGKGYIVDSLKG